jgi:hypothetical protein
VNPDRCIAGLATCYDAPRRDNGGGIWKASQFDAFIECEVAIPLRVGDGAVLDHRGCLIDYGACRRFASVVYPKAGLLTLAEVSEGEHGDQPLHDLGLQLSRTWLPPSWSFSIGAHVADGEAVLPFEVSIVCRPAYGDAAILGVARGALDVWELLTEQQVPA